jgi:hypothetical protein
MKSLFPLLYFIISTILVVAAVLHSVHSNHLLDEAAVLLHRSSVAAAANPPHHHNSELELIYNELQVSLYPWSSLSYLTSTSIYSSHISFVRLVTLYFTNNSYNLFLAINLYIAALYLLLATLISFLYNTITSPEYIIIRENTCNFALFRLVFLGALVRLESNEILLWLIWFSLLISMRIIILIARERFDSITQQDNTANNKSLYVITIILVSVIVLINISLALFIYSSLSPIIGFNVLSLILFENFALLIGGLKVVAKYSIHLIYLLTHEELVTSDNNHHNNYESRQSYIYMTEFVFQVVSESATLAHFLQIWSYYGLSFTLIDLFLFLNLRSILVDLTKRIIAFNSWRRATTQINQNFPNATGEELLAANDSCAICREPMTAAKKLPCGHMFHANCLLSWIEHRSICPSCRREINTNNHNLQRNAEVREAVLDNQLAADLELIRQMEIREARNNPNNSHNPNNIPNTDRAISAPAASEQKQQQGGTHHTNSSNSQHIIAGESLLRFSSNSNLLTRWLPLPAFSFEVIRARTDGSNSENSINDNISTNEQRRNNDDNVDASMAIDSVPTAMIVSEEKKSAIESDHINSSSNSSSSEHVQVSPTNLDM